MWRQPSDLGFDTRPERAAVRSGFVGLFGERADEWLPGRCRLGLSGVGRPELRAQPRTQLVQLIGPDQAGAFRCLLLSVNQPKRRQFGPAGRSGTQAGVDDPLDVVVTREPGRELVPVEDLEFQSETREQMFERQAQGRAVGGSEDPDHGHSIAAARVEFCNRARAPPVCPNTISYPSREEPCSSCSPSS